jgi:hypothetical protein
MAKIYPYEVFKIKREIQSLELDLQQMLTNSYLSWVDRYRVDQTKKRIVELKIELKAILIDDPQ